MSEMTPQDAARRVVELEAKVRSLETTLAYKTLEARRWREWYEALQSGTDPAKTVDDRFTFGT